MPSSGLEVAIRTRGKLHPSAVNRCPLTKLVHHGLTDPGQANARHQTLPPRALNSAIISQEHNLIKQYHVALWMLHSVIMSQT